MAAITIKDIPTNRALDCKAMSSVKGGGAGWVFGWIRPYVDASPRDGFGPPVNLYQTNNFFSADQMNIEIEAIDINNSAANANINVNAKQQSLNFKV